MSNITIIGGSGFIGTELIKTLINDHNIQNLDIANSTTHPNITQIADVRNLNALRQIKEGTDLVILLAAEHKDNVTPVSLYYDVNVEGTKKVLEIMVEKNINSIIFTSSVAIYGLNKENPDESHPADPFNNYGKSKWQAEEALNKWYEQQPDKRSLKIIRPTVVFGENNRGNVFNLLKQIKSGKFIMIGKGQNKKSMSYIGNIVSFIGFLIKQDQKGKHIYNYADKPDLTTLELVEIVYAKMGTKKQPITIPYFIGYAGGLLFDVIAFVTRKKFAVSSVRIKKFCATTQFNAEKISAEGFKRPYTLQEGLKRTIDSI